MSELARRMLWLPEEASTFARRVDSLHYFVISVTMIASLLIGLVAIYFVFRYAQKHPLQTTPRVAPSAMFEVAVISVPAVFFLLWFGIGYRDFVWYSTPPKDAMDVYVMGKKWMWKFSYPDGPNAVSILHVPVGRPVRLLMTSRDVIHSFWLPEFRIKQDVLPGRYTATWFEATRPGRYKLMCAEYCGTWHSEMGGEVVVMEAAEFDAWLLLARRGKSERQDSSGEFDVPLESNLIAEGRRVAAAKGCLKCHSIDGTPHIGPSWLDLYLRSSPLANGEVVIADEAYITRSIVLPLEQLVRGYRPVMPSYQGRLEPLETAAIVAYIKSLRSARPEPASPEEAAFEPVSQ